MNRTDFGTHGTQRRCAPFLAILLLAPLAGAAVAQDVDPPEETATVRVTPHINGDVELSLYSDADGPGLRVLARSTLRCDWVGRSDWSGTCRKLLHSDGSRVEGQLTLAPLVWILRGEGAQEIRVTVDAAGQPGLGEFGAWRKRTTSVGHLFKSKHEYYEFVSRDITQFPPAFTVQMGEPWNPARVATPIVFVLFGPALVALWLRRRDERRGTAGSAVVRLSWVLTASFLYWISALRISDILGLAVRLNLTNPLAALALGTALYALPILLSTACCTMILVPSDDADSPAQRRHTLGIVLFQQAALLVPLGVFLSGSGMAEFSIAITLASLPGAYALYKIMKWWAGRAQMGSYHALATGDLYARIVAIAASAGVRLQGVFVLGNSRAAESNAFATSKGQVLLTRGLVENLTRREVDAVVAHEVGHLRGKHPSIQGWLIVIYYVLLIPASALLPQSGPGALIASLPIFPIVYILVAARLSQRHEYSADARAVSLTGDAEGKIAALARLRRLSKSPVHWGGIQGSILSHPSMRQRVLALGDRFGVPPERALAILDDPDVLDASLPAPEAAAPEPASAVSRHYALPVEMRDTGIVFTSSTMAAYSVWAFWTMQVVLVAILAAMAYVSERVMRPGLAVLLLFASIPAAAWLYVRVANVFEMLFRRWLESRIRRRIPGGTDAIFAGLLPGEVLRPCAGGCYEWDLGLLSLAGGRLTYAGERTGFSLPRSEIAGFAIRKGPLAWDREHAVLVRHTGGAFLLKQPGYAWWRARRLEKKLTAWWRGELAGSEASVAEPLPPPALPVLAFHPFSRWKLAWGCVKQAAILFFGLSLVLAALGNISARDPLYSVLVVVTPLAFLLVVTPHLLRRSPR
jgi:Zn-dependent protease with chaperone function